MASNTGDEDQPITVRRKTRSSLGLKTLHSSNPDVSQAEGMETPPLTPVLKKKRVRFSAPGPSVLADELSTGLSPANQRISKVPKAKVPNRRHSAPSTTWNLDFSNGSPVSGTQQFLPLRQVLSGRVKRRLRRRGLSEEINNIESERKTRDKSRLAELKRLKAELEDKDNAMRHMRDEWDLRSQFGDEVGNSQSSQLNDKVRELESQIEALQNELKRREVEPSVTNDALTNDEHDWTYAARDPFHDYDDDDDDEPMPHYDNDFDDTTNMNDIIASTPTRHSFPSPPSTVPQTPPNIPDNVAHNTSSLTTVSIQADFVDPEKEKLEKQLAILQADLTRLSAAMEKTKDHNIRLSSKLSEFMPSESSSFDESNLDTALDTLLTRLALSQSSLTETTTTLDALRTEIRNLGFSSTSSPNEILALIASQFRQARLDLEYLNPGEVTTGFENSTLLTLLVSRIRVLLDDVKSRDTEIDQYRSQEISLQEQLSSQVRDLEVLRQELTEANTRINSLTTDLSWQTSSNEKLKKALEGYREEVKGLEDLIGRMETDHCDAESQLKRDLEAAVRRTEALEADVESYKIEQETSHASLAEKDLLLKEFKQKLDSALATITSLTTELQTLRTEKDLEISKLTDTKNREIEALNELMSQRVDDAEEDFLADIATREESIEALEKEISDLRWELRSAEDVIRKLEGEKDVLGRRIRDERGRANGVVMVMREQLRNALNVGQGFLQEDDDLDQDAIPTHGLRTDSKVGGQQGDLLKGKYARRRSSSSEVDIISKTTQKKSRRKYDSGLGFLDEEEEEIDEEMEVSGKEIQVLLDSEGNEILEM